MHRSLRSRGAIVSLKGTLIMAFVGLALALLPARAALAAEDASLTLNMAYEESGKTQQVDGVAVALYKVAELDDAINHYTLLERYGVLGVDFDEGLNASQMLTAAKQAAEIAKADEPTAKAVSDATGKAAFGTLGYGVYLAVQTDATGTAVEYDDFEPFLISVPQITADEIVFNVVSDPKLTPGGGIVPHEDEEVPPKRSTEEPKKPTTPTTPTTKLTQTSDLLNVQMVVACVAAGGALLAVGVVLRRRWAND